MPTGVYKHRGVKGRHWSLSKELKEKWSKVAKENNFGKWMKGRPPLPQSFKKGEKKLPLSDEHRRKLSEANKNRYIKFPELRKKISDKLRGDKSSLWKGGIDKTDYSIDWTRTLRRSIRERDHYVCQKCNEQFEILDVHHIDYNKKNCNPSNLITLCSHCHRKTNFNRNYWINYFKGREQLEQHLNNLIK